MVSLRRLTKKEILLFIGSFLICVLVNIGYYSFFTVSSGAGDQHLEATSTGISLSFIASVTVFGPILEEFVFRGILQGAVFENSWLGLALIASLSSLSCMHLMMFLRLSIIYLEVWCCALLIKRVKIYRWLF